MIIRLILDNSNLILWILSIFNFITLIALVFFERRNPDKVIKWMGVLLFLPFLGFVFYMFFGKGPSFGRRKKVLNKFNSDNEYRQALQSQTKFIDTVLSDENPKLSEIIKYNITENSAMCTTNNDVKLYTNMQEKYSDLFTDIASAKKYINVLYFIIKPDYYGKTLVNLLATKASEGVEVRLLYDDFGSILTNKSFFKPIIKAGGKVFPFFPFRWRGFSGNFNYRNHRKIVVVDGKIGYIGGANIGKEYCGFVKKTSPWRDSHLRITGTAVNFLNMRFLQDYNFASKENLQQEFVDFVDYHGNYPIQVVSCGPDSPTVGIEAAYIKTIYSAEKSIYLQTPYLILDEPFKFALIAAAKSGIDVHVMIPGKPDKRMVYYSTTSFAEELVKNGIKVHIYEGFLHAKTLLIDDMISSVGTFNIDIRSFKLHFEVTAFIYGEEFGCKLKEAFDEDLTHCIPMDEEFLKKRSLLDKFLERIMILFSPLF